MRCIYINLDEAIQRREAVEQTFRDNCPPSWKLERLPACDCAYVVQREIPGKIRPAEKACFLSHLKALERARELNGPVLIAEDDTVFSAATAGIVEDVVRRLPPDAWDLLFTDVDASAGGFQGLPRLFDLCALHGVLTNRNRFKVLDLRTIPFWGLSCYVVNERSKQKVIHLLRDHYPLTTPVDLLISQKVLAQDLLACVIFPFATSLSEHHVCSQIQTSDAGVGPVARRQTPGAVPRAIFRRGMWVGCDCNAVGRTIDAIAESYDEHSIFQSKILAAIALEWLSGRSVRHPSMSERSLVESTDLVEQIV